MSMRRRDVIAFLGGLAAAGALPRSADAQQADKVHRIGFLRLGPPPRSFIEALRESLRESGYTEGRNIIFDYGIASQPEQFAGLAADLVARKPAALIASGSPALLPLRNATATIPIIFVAAIDPVAIGAVKSLARPGGNVTGLTAVFSDITGKRLEMLKEMLPALSRVALVSRETNPGHAQYVEQMQSAARTLNVQVAVVTANTPDDFEPAFRKLQDLNVGALIQIDDAMFTQHRYRMVELANLYRIPGAYGVREFTELGGFLAIGPSFPDLYRRAVPYIDRILKGAKAAELPVEQASKFEIVVNLRTARMLGLSIAPTVLARADEVIE
jgi:putative ABC transport system substrate-binding protein